MSSKGLQAERLHSWKRERNKDMPGECKLSTSRTFGCVDNARPAKRGKWLCSKAGTDSFNESRKLLSTTVTLATCDYRPPRVSRKPSNLAPVSIAREEEVGVYVESDKRPQLIFPLIPTVVTLTRVT